MDAHKYDEGPSPLTQDYVEAQAKRLGLDEDRAWELYYAAVKKWPDTSDPLGHYDYYDFHDEDEGEAK